MTLGWAQRRGKRGGKRRRQRREEGGGEAKAHLSPALEGRRGKGAPRRALNAERGVVQPERGASAEFPRAARSPCTARPPVASGKLRDPFLGAGGGESAACGRPQALAQPGRLGSQRSGQAPRGLGRRAQSWAAGTVTPVRRILCCAPRRSGGSPNPAAPGPAASIRPQSRAQRKIKSPIPLHAFGDTLAAAAGARPGGGTLGRGLSDGRPSPYQYRAGSRAATSRLPRPLPSPPPALPSEVTETFSCSGEGGEHLPGEGGGMRGGSRGGRGRGGWTVTRRTEAGRSERGAREVETHRG